MTVKCKLCSRDLVERNKTGYCRSNVKCRRASDRERHKQLAVVARIAPHSDGGSVVNGVFRRHDRVTLAYRDGWCVLVDGKEVSIHGNANDADAECVRIREELRTA